MKMNIKDEVISVLEEKENMAAWSEEEYRAFDELRKEYENMNEDEWIAFQERLNKEVEKIYSDLISIRDLSENQISNELKEEIKRIVRSYLIELSVLHDFNDTYRKELFCTDSVSESFNCSIDETLTEHGIQI